MKRNRKFIYWLMVLKRFKYFTFLIIKKMLLKYFYNINFLEAEQNKLINDEYPNL